MVENALGSRVRTKICGLTRREDAAVAVAAGADALGAVLYAPSPRAVSVDQLVAVFADVPAFVSRVGLFVNPDKSLVNAALATGCVDLLQFHGDEPHDFCVQFARPFIKAIRVADDTDILAAIAAYPRASGILLDTYRPGIPGGTGEVFNWQRVPTSSPKPIILAGGLTADNVAAAIRQVKPYAVDVSGGVEASKGIKDHDQIHRFLEGVKGVSV